MPDTTTGFESKPLKVVILNWLYAEDLSVIMDATSELRKRFKRAFPRPEWASPTHTESMRKINDALSESKRLEASKDCPANHGTQCCGYPAICKEALERNPNENVIDSSVNRIDG